MRLELAWWQLGDGDPRIEDLLTNPSFESARKEWGAVPNLLTKLWLTSAATRRWGALMIWDGDKPELCRMPPNVSAQIIGRPPDHRLSFDVLEPIPPLDLG